MKSDASSKDGILQISRRRAIFADFLTEGHAAVFCRPNSQGLAVYGDPVDNQSQPYEALVSTRLSDCELKQQVTLFRKGHKTLVADHYMVDHSDVDQSQSLL